MAKLASKNPATGKVLETLDTTPTKDLPQIFAQARAAQKLWAEVKLKKRAKFLYNLREVILNHREDIVELIATENGKPKVEAITADVLPSIDLLTYFARKAPKILKDRNVSMANPLLRYRQSVFNYCPLGTCLVISPWNFPFFLPFGEIAMGLVSGNAIIFKPSEVTPLIGLKIQELVEEAGFPENIIQTIIGGGDVGAAAIAQGPDKVFFTGSVATGKKILSATSKTMTPTVLELGGKDPMIVMPDADLDYATSAALWGGYSNSGQMCASTERLILHETISREFLERLKAKLERLEQSNDMNARRDLGVVTMEGQKATYESHLKEAEEKGARVLAGGKFRKDKRSLVPTLVTGDQIEKLKIYNEETFGPVIAATTFKSVSEAIQKANASEYGLTASIITKNISLGREMARKLETGSVTINEVAFTAALPETPWGGVKNSGMGRKHSDQGLFEFVEVRHINRPRFGFIAFFKSMWWFPYTPLQYELFQRMTEMYRNNPISKMKAIADFLFTLVVFLKRDKRY